LKIFNREKIENDEKNLIERARVIQDNIEARRRRIGKGKYGRVLKMARKPTNEEFVKTSKITFGGILLIGGLGFLVWLMATQLAPWIAEMLGLI
jgi:protein transport protein SEC61 subunit gamma-like protein